MAKSSFRPQCSVFCLVLAAIVTHAAGARAQSSTPFTGSPAPMPGTVQAEAFDNGGQGVAYFDNSTGNKGGAYRATDVDIEGTADTGGGFNLGWMSAGEWLHYTVNVAAAGTYTLELRVASPTGGGTFHVEFGGVNKTGTLTMPATGGWQTWATVSKTVTLPAGTQVMRVVIDATASNGTFGNLNWIRTTGSTTTPPSPASTPFTGSPVALPGTVQAENFDNGGQNVAYHDKSSGNSGGAYRTTDVDVEGTADSGGGFNLGWMSAGEWLHYTVSVATAGTYTLELRVASPTGGGTFHVEFGGTNKTATMTMPTTGGWQTWTTVSKTVTLSAGTQVMRFVVDATASNGSFGNLNWFRVVGAAATPPPSGSTPFTGTPVALPGTVQLENFDNGGANVAYRDNDSTNRGGAYRATGVDIEATTDSGGGFNVGWIGATEWLNYTVNVPTAGTYTLQVRVASPSAGGRFHVEFNGQDKTGPLTMPTTGGWQTWTTLSTTVNLASGTQIMKVVIDGKAADGLFGNLNWIRVQAGSANSTTLFRQPYLQRLGSTTATVVWATRTPGRAEVWYQAAGQSARAVSAVSALFATSRTGMSVPYYQHVAVLSPLAPSTAYSYEIAHDGVDLTAVTDRFVTAPPEGMGTVRFIAFGDSGVGSTEQRQLAALMAADDFDLALHGGDVTYGLPSSVGGGTYQTLHDWFFSIYQDWLRSRPIFPSIGNHDDEVSFALPYRDVFVLPENAVSSGYADHAERFYSFDYGPVHFVALDTERAFQDPLRRQAQLTWLDDDLRASAQPWKIVFFHRSPYSNGAEHGSDLAVRQAFGPIFERHGVQLVVSAHDHDFERSVPWRQTTVADGQAVTYVVSGGGGARLYAVGQSATTARSVSAHHYVRGTVGDCALTLEAVGLNGAAFDTYTLDRCRQAADVQPPTVAVTSPGGGTTVAGVTSVTVAASDDVRIEKVDLWVDGRLIAIDRTAPYAFSWDTRGNPDGSHTIEVRAYDIAGRISVATRTVVVANGGL